jgi:hypothetical protein
LVPPSPSFDVDAVQAVAVFVEVVAVPKVGLVRYVLLDHAAPPPPPADELLVESLLKSSQDPPPPPV